jgi:hypothetical protein
MVKLYWYEGFTDNLDRRLSLPQTVGFSAGVQLSGIFVLRVEFQSSSVDAANAPETDRWGLRRTGETPGIGGGNRPPVATIIQAQPFVGRMIMVQHRLYGGKALSGRWAGCRFGHTANWNQMIWWPTRI